MVFVVLSDRNSLDFDGALIAAEVHKFARWGGLLRNMGVSGKAVREFLVQALPLHFEPRRKAFGLRIELLTQFIC
jgi:hypothetical protein